MKVFVVYCHPSEDSFTSLVRDSFIKGIVESGNEYIISDLYKMNFKSDMTESEYLRDSNYINNDHIAEDILEEQRKINSSDAIVFIYPVFWTDVPAKLKGWFDRVWRYGFAYGTKEKKLNSLHMKLLEKSLVLCIAGNSQAELECYDLIYAMKKVMLGDRLFNRVKDKKFVVLDGMSKFTESRALNSDSHLAKAYSLGYNLFNKSESHFSVDDRYFTAIENSDSGEVSGQTVFSYHQKDNIVWAEYSGGMVFKGILFGNMDENGCLHFDYQHVNVHNEFKKGHCDSSPEILENGKLRFHESWQWENGESGKSLIQEI